MAGTARPLPTPQDLLAGLNQAQAEAVTAPEGRTIVVAGAGSGKTRVLTRRIGWRVLRGEVDPDRVLALTFTRKAAAELRTRQRQLGLRDRVPAGTIHSFALAQLRQRWTEKATIAPTVTTAKGRLLGQLLPASLQANRLDIMSEIDWARAQLIEPERYGQAAEAAGRQPPVEADEISRIMVRFQQEKRRKRVVDFDDLLTLALRDLRADPHYQAAVQWRHRHFFIDEFQDVNPLQYALLNAWLGDRNDLFIVGDPNQAIYSWNGADPTLLTTMLDEAIGVNDTTVIRLDDNYRSTPQILLVAGATLPVDPKLQANRSDGPPPTITAYATDEVEAAGIADRVRASHSVHARWSDQAVLVRTNAQLVLIEQALAAANIPAEIRSGVGPLASPEVKEAIDRIGRSHDLFLQLEALDEQLSVDTSTLARAALDRHNNLAALSRLLHEFLTNDDRPTGEGFVAWIGTLSGGDVGVDADAVALATFHGAKGLEWPIVHLAGLEDGFVPIAYATTDEQLSEEHRLLYVALTRAEHALHLSWARQRTFGQRSVGRDASPLLAAIDRRIGELGPDRSGQVDWRRHLSTSRNRIASSPSTSNEARPAPSTVETLATLRSWRARKAKAAGVPTHVIATDALLKTIAERRPTTKAQLGALPGVRPASLNRYGDELLALV